MSKETHFCIIIDRATKKELAEIGNIYASDWYYARHIAADNFRKDDKYKEIRKEYTDWCVDSFQVI